MAEAIVEDKVRRVMARIFRVPPESLGAESARESIKLWDSVGQISLITGLEAEFGIRLTDQQCMELRSFSSAMRIVQQSLSAKRE